MDIFSTSTLSSMNTREKQLINDAVDAAENLAVSLESLKSILKPSSLLQRRRLRSNSHFYCERDFGAPIMTCSSGALLITTWLCDFRRVPRACSCIFKLMARLEMALELLSSTHC